MFSTRAYLSSDLQKLSGFVGECQRRSVIPSGFIHAGDVVWRILLNAQAERDVWLWEHKGELVGCVMQKDLFVDFTIAPWLAQRKQKDLLETMLAHAEHHTRTHINPQGKLSTTVPKTARLFLETVQACGYQREGEVFYSFERSLTDIPAIQLPQGFVVRHPEPHELEARVELHRAVWQPPRMTLQIHQTVRAAPIYRPDLDLVVVSPQGEFVAYCIVWFDPNTKTGEFEPVGTHPDWRRKGLGKAVLLEGFRRLKELGAEKALVSFFADNLEYYQSVGFKEVNQWLDFSKGL
jgi:ribosomal protein S18 acetylase RimI-like enzyme